jgi:hypothetical protein
MLGTSGGIVAGKHRFTHLSLALHSPCSILCRCRTSLVWAARSAAAFKDTALLLSCVCC